MPNQQAKSELREKETPIAYELAKKQKEISVAEFFTKNRHLLGFDNKRKALLMAVKEAVDNSLDASEEARILPEVSIEIIEMSEFKYKVVIEDNGPGIVKKQIPNIFAKLLYGSKFHTLRQARGQQGIGISAAVLYAQLTTGRNAKITSRVSKKEPAYYYELGIDTQNNKPVIAKEETVEWAKEHGTKVELDLEAEYIKGNQSVDEYLKQTAVINPHVTIIYTNPKSEQVIYARATDKLPDEPKEIKPHPYGVELGMLMDKLRWTESRTLQSFLTSEFSRVGPGTAKEICEHAAILPNTKPSQVSRDMAEKLLQGIQKTKIIAPPTDCLSPIGEELLEKGLRKEIKAEFYIATSRTPSVYRGNPFVIEIGCAYGGEIPKEEKANILRFANRVPLLYQEGACSMTKSIMETNWKPYGLQQSGDSIPIGPVVIVVHMSSVWVPFTSESKEAIAHYAEIIKEIKLALQECGRLLGTYVRKKYRITEQIERANMFEKYIPEIADSLSVLAKENKEKILQGLQKMLVKPEIKKEIVEEDSDDKLYRMEFKKENEEVEKETV
ncbi:DNA topoisomerase VI subunit B [Candidatus Woesearchaeota archaeon]|nr:DNA topoisomerase VI subunit B [Candidatus Woesearchaeota archaeon]